MPDKKLGLWSSTTYVVGNMIGSGIFMLPAALATYGGISLLSWIIAAAGALLLAYVFKSLSKSFPNLQGGPYVFTREGLGEFPAFLVAWGYWISIWCTNAALAVAFVSYLTVFFPVLNTYYYLAIGTGLAAIWLLTWLNTRKITLSGNIQLITTILKLLPLVSISIVGIFFINTAHFTPFNRTEDSTFYVLMVTVTLTLFAFLGLESATIPAHNVRDPQRTVPRATMIGTSIAVLVYMVSTTSVMGILPPEVLQKSNAPFADAAAILWGESARNWVAAGALISTFGALNGWILMQGQIPAAAAKDNLFPKLFKKENRNLMPTTGLVISSILASAVMVLNFTKGFAGTYKFIILLATLTSLLPYIFSTASFLIFELKQPGIKKLNLKVVIGLLAFLFGVFAVAGSGEETVYYGFLMLLSGIPFYIWMKRNQA
ncbi:MAG: amino acid permease [Flavobacteriales bacterium]